jgi:hypothetical protein
MPIELEIEAAGRTAAAGVIFDRLDGEGYVSLPVLNGADLCMLGGPKHPFFWEPLATEWLSLRPRDRNGYIEARTKGMIEDGRLIEIAPGDGYRPGASYAVSPELGILLAARSRPTFVIASHFSSRLAPLSLFGVGDETEPVRGVVMAVPVRPPGKAEEFAKPSPIADVFDHILTTTGHAAEFLADRVITPAPTENRFQKQPHRLVTLFRPGDRVTPAAELSVLGNGTTARVAGAGVSGEFDKETLRTVLLDLFGRGAPAT